MSARLSTTLILLVSLCHCSNNNNAVPITLEDGGTPVSVCQGEALEAPLLSTMSCEFGVVRQGEAVSSCEVTLENTSACTIELQRIDINNPFFEIEETVIFPEFIASSEVHSFHFTARTNQVGQLNGQAIFLFRYSPSAHLGLSVDVQAPAGTSEPTPIVLIKSVDDAPYQGFEPLSPFKSIVLDCMSSGPSEFASQITRCDWQLTSMPSQSGVQLTTARGSQTGFSYQVFQDVTGDKPQTNHGADLVGQYEIQLTVFDNDGQSATTEKVLNLRPVEGRELYVELMWESDMNLDLMLTTNGADLCDAELSCRHANCIDGASSYTADFDGDGIETTADPRIIHIAEKAYGPEVLELERPLPGIYDLGVRALGVTENTPFIVRVYQDDRLRLSRQLMPPLGQPTDIPYIHIGSITVDDSFNWTFQNPTTESDRSQSHLACPIR